MAPLQEERRSYYSQSPHTPPNTPPIDSITIDFKTYEDAIVSDLQNMDDIFDSLSVKT